MSIRILHGDCRETLRELDAGSVHMVATSPPYLGLRQYGTTPIEWPAVTYAPMPGLPPVTIPGCDPECDHDWSTFLRPGQSGGTNSAKVQIKGQENFQIVPPSEQAYCQRCGGWRGDLGLEPDPLAYIGHLVLVFRELWRVLRSDGVAFLNLGDSFVSQGGPLKEGGGINDILGGKKETQDYNKSRKTLPGLKPKDLMMIPHRAALALQADGWYVRMDLVWAKGRDGDIEECGPGNVMPESTRDRCTKAHEYIFHLAKKERYYWDAEAIRETWADKRNGASGATASKYIDPLAMRNDGGVTAAPSVNGRNARSVWLINTSGYSGAHFATWPERLVERLILAGSSPTACGTCGAPWARVMERPPAPEKTWEQVKPNQRGVKGGAYGWQPDPHRAERARPIAASDAVTTGWSPTCPHDDPTGKSVVLDCFAGSGTTMRVAERHGRDSIGCELSPEYLKLIDDRTDGVQTSLVSLL